MNHVRLYNSVVGKRNVELREILLHIKEATSVIGVDLEVHFGWTKGKVNKATHELVSRGFLTSTYEICPRGKRCRYSLAEFEDRKLDKELPISAEMAEFYGNNRKGIGRFGAGKPKPKKPAISRDPLDIYLMGTGVAPSILFHRSQHA